MIIALTSTKIYSGKIYTRIYVNRLLFVLQEQQIKLRKNNREYLLINRKATIVLDATSYFPISIKLV